MPASISRVLSLTPLVVALASPALLTLGCERGSSPTATGQFGPSTSADAPLRAEDAYPSDAGASEFDVIAKEGGESGRVTVSIEPQSESSRWRLIYQRTGEDAPFREDVIASTDSGAVMIETTDHERDALTVYGPPLTLMPKSLAPGEPFEQEVAMVVHPPGDRNTVRRRGSGRQTLELVGAQSVQTSAGRLDALHVRSRFEAELAPARVVNDTERWYAPDQSAVGFIAERYDEALFIFGVQSSTRGHLWIWRAND